MPPMDIFFELHRDLPREGPGDDASTCRAYSLLPGLPPRPRLLDIGCGPGMQTLALARLSAGSVVAVDTHQPFLDELERRARRAGLAGRIATRNMSMFDLKFDEAGFDAIWSEGAIYILGFERGLREWKPLLRPGGCLAVTELSWLKADPPAEAAGFWREGYPAMKSVEQNLDIVRAAGYRLIDHFVLPESAWWEGYYTPLEARIPGLEAKHRDDGQAMQVLQAARQECDLYRRFAGWYGYVFYVMQAD